ncbi:MAG: HIT family protein [Acholeplasmataceae bacterium]
MKDKNCIFCKIINGEIPSSIVYEDDDVLAILDISQATYGHTLVMPKVHFTSFLDVPHDVMHKVMDVAQRIGQVEIKLLGAKGVNILSNCYEAAGQSVMHFHVHVIPRYQEEEGFRLEMKSHPDNLNLPALAEAITKNLK